MKAGTVVICDYINFKGEAKRALFVVLQDEQFDPANSGTINFTAIKLTTQFDMVGNYTVNINIDDNPFLNAPCLASCSKIHTLHKHQISRVIGKLSPNTFKKVYITTHNFLSEINRQMLSEI